MHCVFGRAPSHRKPGRQIDNIISKPAGFKLSKGVIITTPPPAPLEYRLAPLQPRKSDTGPHMPAYFDHSFWSLMREDLVQALGAAGVDNLQTFDTILHDPDSGESMTHYKAFNLVGLVAAADMAKAKGESLTGGPPLVDVFFSKLVLDEAKTHDLLMFRLAEAPSTILVHRSVRESLEQHFPACDDLAFWDAGDVAAG